MKRKTFSSRLLAILMTVALVLSFASVSAFAEGEANGESSSQVTIQKYDDMNSFGTIDVPENNSFGVPEGNYIAVPIEEGQIVYLKQNESLQLIFGISEEEMTADIWQSIINAPTQNGGKDGNFKKVDVDEDGKPILTYPESKRNGIFAYESQGTNEGNYYYGYKDDNGQMYLLISSTDKVSHIDVVSGITPSTGDEKTSQPDLTKKILVDGQEVDADTVAAGQPVTFELSSTLPKPLTGESYTLTFHDEMNEAFETPTGFTVKIGDTTLEAEDYTVISDPTDECTFEISMDLVVLKTAGKFSDDDLGNEKVVVTYTATLKEGTTAGDYQNTSWVTYPGDQSEEDVVDVYTYAIKIAKTDATTKEPLADAGFTLYASDGKTEVVAEQKTNENGQLTFNGLDAGTYVLKETSVPNGYVDAKFSQTITLPEEAGDDYIYEISVANTEQGHTGGAGTMFYTFGGLAIVAAAGVVLLASRKSRKQSA